MRGAALRAPRNFGEPSRSGRLPRNATVAVEQQEFLASELGPDTALPPVLNFTAVLGPCSRAAPVRDYSASPATAEPSRRDRGDAPGRAALRAGNEAGAVAER